MARDGKKQDAEAGAAAADKSLEQLILDQSTGKYGLVSSTSVWATELRRLEEHRHLSQNEILDLALKEVLTGKVSPEQIQKAAAAAIHLAETKDAKDKK